MVGRVNDPRRRTFGKLLVEHGASRPPPLTPPFWSLPSSEDHGLTASRRRRRCRPTGTVLQDIARSRAEIDQARLLILAAAHQVRPAGS